MIGRQRARIANLKDGDTNTAFFHHQCSYRRQKNHIHSFMVGDQVIDQPTEMAEAAFAHFDALLDTAVDRDCTLNLEQLIHPSDDLAELDEQFTDAEIWGACSQSARTDSPPNFFRPAGPW
jgi:hypothetical protein